MISYVAVTAWIVIIVGIRCKQQKYQLKVTRFNGQSSPVLTPSMKTHQLDMQRTTMMEALYAKSGRTCCTYTGLWEDFCKDIGPNFRDADYEQLHITCARRWMTRVQSWLQGRRIRRSLCVVATYWGSGHEEAPAAAGDACCTGPGQTRYRHCLRPLV